MAIFRVFNMYRISRVMVPQTWVLLNLSWMEDVFMFLFYLKIYTPAYVVSDDNFYFPIAIIFWCLKECL